MQDEAMGLDFWQEPIAVDHEVGFRVNSEIADDIVAKLKEYGIETTEAIQNVQEAIDYQV